MTNTARFKDMKIADNIKCKDFEIRAEWAGSRLAGQENLWNYRVYYKGHEVEQKYMAHTKTAAKAFISAKVRKVNAVLNKARKLKAEAQKQEKQTRAAKKGGGRF